MFHKATHFLWPRKKCKPCRDWSEPISPNLARFSEKQACLLEKRVAMTTRFLESVLAFEKLASFFALWNIVSWLQKRAYQSSQSHMANVKASSLWKLACFLVKWFMLMKTVAAVVLNWQRELREIFVTISSVVVFWVLRTFYKKFRHTWTMCDRYNLNNSGLPTNVVVLN